MGGGTTFVVALPIRPPADVPAPQTAAAAAV
jgi:hypothetical protein